MRVIEGRIPGTLLIAPDKLPDDRGAFYESLRSEALEQRGIAFRPEQINYSVSRRHTLRGIHGTLVPPGQAKFVTCVRGAVRDIAVELRLGSPAFGTHQVAELDAASGRSVYLPDGVGHGFLALTDDACVCYMVAPAYVPGTQLDINPLDPDLDLPWRCPEAPLISDKDLRAPTVAEATEAGLLPEFRERITTS
jgi:NDP-hexose 3,5-(Or5-) epimerase